MAPVTATNVGMTPQRVDSPKLRVLLDKLNSSDSSSSFTVPLANGGNEETTVQALVQELGPYAESWCFEEQADLYDWIPALNAIDAAITYLVKSHPSLLLVAPVSRNQEDDSSSSSTAPLQEQEQTAKVQQQQYYARSLQDVASVPEHVIHQLSILLKFSSTLLTNSTSKNVYNSVLEVADLLGAANDTVATLALQTLQSLAIPPSLHKQVAPELSHHSTSLHNAKQSRPAHARLLSLARGWGTKASGLGLLQCVTADDSEYGQGGLSPRDVGHVQFDFYTAPSQSEQQQEANGEEHSKNNSTFCRRIELTNDDIVVSPTNTTSGSTDEWMTMDEGNDDDTDVNADGSSASNGSCGSKKRRKMSNATASSTTATTKKSQGSRQTRPTAELFFACIRQAGGRRFISETKLFALLADIRLARAFYSHETRVQAVENRLGALVSILFAHPSQQVVSGYFQAQPELCVELIDLLRPTVSSASVSAASARPRDNDLGRYELHSISALANSPQVPYRVRSLAVEALTALVARRDGASGGLTGVAKQSAVLGELGVGKGLYLGLLPTLIRYSLASLNAFLSREGEKSTSPSIDAHKLDAADAIGMDIGMAFVKATMPPPLPLGEQLRRALEFVDTVLTLTSSVVSVPSGTAALTECGLIPSLLSTVAIDAKRTPDILSESSPLGAEERDHARSLLRFITSQSVQILEGAVVSHNNALSAFHDLQGIDVLISRLSIEMEAIRQTSRDESVPMDTSDDVEMADVSDQDFDKPRSIHSSQRVLLFSIVNCLTVVFHQESGAATNSPIGGIQLRKPEVTIAIKEVMSHIDSYGGVLAALIASLLSDVMNSDPQVVHHVHGSGIAESFLTMLKAKDDSGRPMLPPVAELVMALPNVLSALSLTEDGASAVAKANPFPALLALFYTSEYCMPKSRCMLNEMTAIVGTGLDEIMRHVPRHRPLILKAVVEAMEHVVDNGSRIAEQEEALDLKAQVDAKQSASLEEQRTCLMQYAVNFGQMLEQILHSDEHCDPFVKAGGLDAILKLFPCLMPSGSRFLAHVCCLSCPSVCTITHSTTEDQLSMAFKCIALHQSSGNLVTKMVGALEAHLESIEVVQRELREVFTESSATASDRDLSLSAEGILEHLPRVPLHDAIDSVDFNAKAVHLSRYFRAVIELQWLSNLLAGIIRAGSQRNLESGLGWGRNEFRWKKELFSSPTFVQAMKKLSLFCQSSNLEVCRIRTEDGFEERDRRRLKKHQVGASPVRYRLRIVCQEGAIVRNGVEIDSCASVGSMEMGEVAEAYDRCINSSGVMRYRTSRGWVSELTRGHGREPIAEVLSVWKAKEGSLSLPEPTVAKETFNCGIADVCSVGASILARMQSSYCELFSSLSRELVQSFKVLPVRSLSFDESSVGGFVRGLLQVLTSNIKDGFHIGAVATAMTESPRAEDLLGSSSRFVANDAAISMYIGAQLGHLQACLYEEKRERRNLNVPLLVRLFYTDEDDYPTITSRRPFFLKAIQFLFRQSLLDFQERASSTNQGEKDETDRAFPRQCLSRTVAASLPPTVSLLLRLIPSKSVSSSSLTSILDRLSKRDCFVLMADGTLGDARRRKEELSFRPDYFTKALHCAISETLLGVWRDPLFAFAPAQVVHPVASLVREVMSSLEDSTNASTNSSEDSRSGREQWGLFSRTARSRAQRSEANGDVASAPTHANFEPSEEAVAQLTEMGFSRDHALDALESTRTNRVDVAMEYALLLGQLSPDELSARRAAREERERRTIPSQEGTSSRNERTTRAVQESANDDDVMADNGSNGEGVEGGETAAVSSGSAGDKKLESDHDAAELLTKRLETCCRSWVECAPQVVLDVMTGSCDNIVSQCAAASDGLGDAEAEALVVVLCSFLLDFCQRYPEKRTEVVSKLLDRLVSLFAESHVDNDVTWSIPPEKDSSFASLCHAAVLCTRALPMTRILVLQKGMVRRLVSSIQCCTHSPVLPGSAATTELSWPIWLGPSLLLLDVMAQPVVATSEQLDAKKDDTDTEFAVVCEERDERARAIAQAADSIFSAVRQFDVENGKKSIGGMSSSEDGASNDTGMSNDDNASDANEAPKKGTHGEETEAPTYVKPFSSVPPYFPLLAEDSAGACMSVCLDLLGMGKTDTEKKSLPPGVVQAALSLLMHVLRSPKMASQCLNLGAAELILQLPRECRFSGSAGSVTVILRRLLEDETTLQSSMASEIRHAMSKLGEQSRRSSPSSEGAPRVSSSSFMQTVTPLICRDPVSFLKAAATTVSFECREDKGEPADRSKVVVLLSNDQSSRNSRALASLCSAKVEPVSSSVDKRGTRAATGAKSQRQRPQGVKPASFKRCATKKSRKDRSNSTGKKNSPVNGTPANHIMCLLISKVVALASQRDCGTETFSGGIYGESNSFLWLADALEVMANLVLAVPACAAAVHRYRFSSNNGNASLSVSHALGGCPSPPRTFVNYLLHSILPQDRWTFKREQLTWDSKNDNDESAKCRKKAAHMTTRVAQTSARLLVALVARAGEGRRRVVADLAFAFSGGSLGHASSSSPLLSSAKSLGLDDYEYHSLQAWGDLCMGLAAPRSSGASNENTSTLSFEVVKLMLDSGMAHALLYAIHRVRLQHPMAASTCASLLLPLELFTRGSVTDSVQSIADKESAESERQVEPVDGKPKGQTGGDASVPASSSQPQDSSFAFDNLLEDAFDVGPAARASRSQQQRHQRGETIVFDEGGDERMDDADGDYDTMADNVDESNDSDEDEMDVGDDDDDEVDEERDSDDEGMSSDDESDVTEAMEEASESDQGEDETSGHSHEEVVLDDFDDETGNQEAMDDFFDGGGDEEDVNEGAAPINQGDFDVEDGWTRIDSTGFGGMLFGARGAGRAATTSISSRSTRGFIDAAEAMIGSLLRSGEIDRAAISEIEGTLGIRIVAQNQDPFESDESIGDRLFAGILPSRGSTTTATSMHPASSSNFVGTVPHIHQRIPPEVGYTAMGGGGRWNEISAMEYVYGGPSVAAGSRNYDLSRTHPPERDSNSYPTPSQVDMRLFPGGPASATHARTEPSLHPLLCGVDLPPMNALVSDLRPHGARAQTNRRNEEWNTRSGSSGGYLVSASGGNTISVNRGTAGRFAHSGTRASNQATSTNGLIGWTDDGLSFDSTVANFSTAFERALGESMIATQTREEPVMSPGGDAHQPLQDEARASRSEDPESDGVLGDSGTRDASSQRNQAAESGTQGSHADSNDASANDQQREEDREHIRAGGASPGDGDGVASSLAEGLRLSPRSEEGVSNDQTITVAEQQDEVAQRGDGASEAAGARQGSTNTNAPMQQDQAGQPSESHVSESEAAVEEEAHQPEQHSESQADASPEALQRTQARDGEVLTCPPGMDQEVFNSLPADMQREVVEQNRIATEVAGQLDSASGLDPEALAALPEEMRREVIEQDQRERREREQAPADPSNAEEMDNASFLVSLAPDLREEILLTADEAFLNSLPPNIVAEAQILRERASMQHARRASEDPLQAAVSRAGQRVNNATVRNGAGNGPSGQARKKQRPGKMRLECDRSRLVYVPSNGKQLSPLPGVSDVKVLLRLLYLRSPVRPQRLLQKVFQNICTQDSLRRIICTVFVQLLNEDGSGANAALQTIANGYSGEEDWRKKIDAEFGDGPDGFPPSCLVGAAPDVSDTDDFTANSTLFKHSQMSSTSDSISASLPASAKCSTEDQLPPVVATSIIDTLLQLSKSSPRICLDALKNELVGTADLQKTDGSIIFDKLLDLLDKPPYSKSSASLEHLLNLIEIMVSPLSLLPRHGEEEHEISQRDIDSAAAAGKEWVDVPRIVVSQQRLQLLCSILRMESCRDAAFTKVNSIARRLCRVDANRGCVLDELASVSQSLAADAICDLKTLYIRMQDAVSVRQQETSIVSEENEMSGAHGPSISAFASRSASSSVALSISSSELKLLRVLQTLQSLCLDTSSRDDGGRKDGNIFVTDQLIDIFRSMKLDDLWTNLDRCLNVVKVLEGVTAVDEMDEKNGGNDHDEASDDGPGGNKLQNSVAGLLTRFLPIIEAFFVVNASYRFHDGPETSKAVPASSKQETNETGAGEPAASGEAHTASEASAVEMQALAAVRDDSETSSHERLVEFVRANRVLLNALVRNNPGLLEKGLRAIVQFPRCRAMLDFDVKRHWFKTQVRRLRQHASRRHGSLRLSIRRRHVFEDAYHQLRLRNADEMRGRLHITFRGEEGVDAGGLSREFFGILAKEIFNPNYALFTSTEDGCTFQPNPNSSINPDHLSYFRFVGRIVGKAVADGFLLDAHFTRSLYKHMLGQTPTVFDMEAIDPDYYKNLQMILEHNLEDIGLELTFSIEDYSFGRRDIVDLLPNGRNIAVTEDSKEKYVSYVCQRRMTTAISSQIKAYLDGFYEMVSPDLIAIFTPRELELLISGLPDIDVTDLRNNTEYQGYRAADKEIQWFWNILSSLSRSEKAAFLQFVTGSSKVPLAGFSELQGMRGIQKFSIHKVGGSSGALMSAHTCFNSLDLPVYGSEEEMREKLLYAISEGGGAFMFA